MDDTGLTVVRQGMEVVVVSIGTEHFKQDILQEVVNGESAELVRVLVPMKSAQASFQSLRLSADSHHTSFAQSSPPSYTKLLQITTLWWSGLWYLS